MLRGQPEALEQPYDPARIEARWYREWETQGVFKPRPTGKPPFVIMIPPPNVTGSLTMGHVLGESVRDLVVRWQRMEGRETLWVPGMDHAGIATQNVVEKSLRERGVSRHDLGREGFLREVWAWKQEYGGLILKQLRRLGISADWARERFTLDEGYSRAVLLVFQKLHERGLVYRGHRIVNWCPRCQTALSDEEVDHVETDGHLWYIRYPIKGTEKSITVATTRPETMLGDTGIAVSPKDRRYAHLVGKTAVLPLLRREIPIVADPLVDPKFGTGAVKITPAHDPNDFVMGERHDLPKLVVMDERGVMNDHAGDFRGLDRFAARERVVEALRDAGYLERVEPHRHAVGHCERCDTIIEPYLSLQWFVKMAPLAAPALEAAKKGQVKFYPARWKKVYLHWMENIRDWCISRQLWWGHRIPVWYRGEELVVSAERPEGEGWTQDQDVLDTWFSSWLWPFATLGWPEETADLTRYYPNTLMITGSDIIFFWVARMIMAGYAFMGQGPFPHVYFTSIIRDSQGRKMSKSLGNSPDPLAMMDRFGADAVRFTMIYLTPTGQDLQFDEKRVETGKFFANKVWNAARLVSLRLGDEDLSKVRESSLTLALADRWILSRFAHAVKNTTRNLKTYRFNEAANTLYHFTWNEYCDWYLEMAKPRWGDDDSEGFRDLIAQAAKDESALARLESMRESRRAARWVAWRVLDGILRLLHPFMPFVSEEIWQALPHDGDLLATASWPRARTSWLDPEVERQVAFLQELVVAVRNLRVENGIAAGKQVPVIVRGDPEQLDLIERLADQVRHLARLGALTLARDGSRPQVAASALVRGAEVFLPLEGLVDLDEERARLARDAAKLMGDLEIVKKKLRNRDFLDKARPEIVEKERGRLAALEESLDKLKRAQESLRAVQS
ncbi:MAG: valine--tRNA ligase [Candidatus Eisenbacteria bacterium]|uniref:Valine--tRNA ligase n=1 Tax=Eiseniibacteriota bacterium TaxID=2212470 RepID=A0A538U5L4_UNCEI|nr:MAG: valine--tRNA ligase [Candidatus Eisenbacteria bacterium]